MVIIEAGRIKGEKKLDILVTLNAHYLRPLMVMLTSLVHTHPEEVFHLYVAHRSLTKKDFTQLEDNFLRRSLIIHEVALGELGLKDAPVSSRFPQEMYYRIFAAQYLPQNLDRILYLDPDLVVLNSLEPLKRVDFAGNLMAAASHVHLPLQKLNEARLSMPKPSLYINSGVVLFNLKELRRRQSVQEVHDYIQAYQNRLLYPDQDVLSGLYGDQILSLDPLVYNLSENYWRWAQLNPLNHLEEPLDLKWIRKHTAIVHYCGTQKPWKDPYKGKLAVFYKEYEKLCFGEASGQA